MSSTSTVTSSMNVADTPASRTGIGRPIANDPAALAGAAPAKLVGRESGGNTTSSMSVGSQVPNPVAPRVDQKDLVSGADSRKSGDTAAASVAAISNAPGPRGETGQSGS